MSEYLLKGRCNWDRVDWNWAVSWVFLLGINDGFWAEVPEYRLTDKIVLNVHSFVDGLAIKSHNAASVPSKSLLVIFFDTTVSVTIFCSIHVGLLIFRSYTVSSHLKVVLSLVSIPTSS